MNALAYVYLGEKAAIYINFVNKYTWKWDLNWKKTNKNYNKTEFNRKPYYLQQNITYNINYKKMSKGSKYQSHNSASRNVIFKYETTEIFHSAS